MEQRTGECFWKVLETQVICRQGDFLFAETKKDSVCTEMKWKKMQKKF